MITIKCKNCECEFNEEDARWYDSYPYCEDCFFESYTYCYHCDEPIGREYCRYDSNGESICDECYENNVDDNAPDNPEISDAERKQIVSLCKCWLKGERAKSLIRINKNDFYLSEIQSGAGLVEHTLYLYGLVDRDDFQIKASPNILLKVKEYLTQNNMKAAVIEDRGHSRLGVSRTMRENDLDRIIELIRSITN